MVIMDQDSRQVTLGNGGYREGKQGRANEHNGGGLRPKTLGSGGGQKRVADKVNGAVID